MSIDGERVPPERAVVSVFDRGFLYGDSVYEVLRTYGGRAFEGEEHLSRLARSAERIGLALPWPRERLSAEVARVVAASRPAGPDEEPPAPDAAPWNVGERTVRLVVTRGSGELGLDPALAADPKVILLALPLQAPPLAAYRQGVGAVIVGETAVGRPREPSAKTGAHLAHVLALRQARAAGAHEALTVDRDGFVTEGASSNVFLVQGGAVTTPPLDAGLLPGVTRAVVLALAREAGLTVREARPRPEALAGADELFLTSTAREILPVTRLGDRPVGSGAPGEVTRLLHRRFRARADAFARGG
ncbi:aminotransferase class IV [Anaeromyxobacter paludicola]|uniref:aminotransferase class IV n=1 Tax=Anaeromyxobacter paludicola TaxID=2918171 RepID=UPI0020BE4035|nr:aminotransferase class IV [Anaeromyxobacter paludicola]